MYFDSLKCIFLEQKNHCCIQSYRNWALTICAQWPCGKKVQEPNTLRVCTFTRFRSVIDSWVMRKWYLKYLHLNTLLLFEWPFRRLPLLKSDTSSLHIYIETVILMWISSNKWQVEWYSTWASIVAVSFSFSSHSLFLMTKLYGL